jgi:hypothetical protein
MLAALGSGAWRSLVSARVLGTRGRGFESRRPDQIKQCPDDQWASALDGPGGTDARSRLNYCWLKMT